MKAFLSLVVICSLFGGTVLASDVKPRDPQQYFFNESFWDLTEELETARDEGKKGIMIMFEMDECPFCHRMKKTVLNQPDIQDYFRENFHSLSIDIEGDIEIVDFEGNATLQKDFASKNRVRATPVMAFYDLDGKQVVRYTGAASGTEEFMWLAEFYLEGIYKHKDNNGRKITFGKYKRLKKQQKSRRN